MHLLKTVLLLIPMFLLLSSTCKEKKDDNNSALRTLAKQYENGEISECTYNGAKVYSAGLNAYDAGTEIYDASGKKIGSCYYSTGLVDAICNSLSNCEVIYRCKDHITKQPAVDKYGLFK
jgi:hypothetical protein